MLLGVKNHVYNIVILYVIQSSHSEAKFFVAIPVPYLLSKKQNAICKSSFIWFHTCTPQICHNFPGGCPPHAFLCSIGAIHPHAICWSESFRFDECLDDSQVLGRWHQSQVTSYCETVSLGSRLRHRTKDDPSTRAVNLFPATQTGLLKTKQFKHELTIPTHRKPNLKLKYAMPAFWR